MGGARDEALTRLEDKLTVDLNVVSADEPTFVLIDESDADEAPVRVDAESCLAICLEAEARGVARALLGPATGGAGCCVVCAE